MKIFIILALVILLNGCHLLPHDKTTELPKTTLVLCPKDEFSINEKPCELLPWLQYWIDASQLSWPARKAMITDLSPQTSDLDSLKVILLSHVNDTPYQTRLRAQTYAQKLQNNQREAMSAFIQFIVYEPSQRHLELESAITTLSRINADNAKQIQIQQTTIEQQARQIDQLLLIEQTIVNETKEEQQ